MSLFRDEVQAKRKDYAIGEVIIVPPRFGWFSLVFGCGFLAVLSIALVLCKFSWYEHATGTIASSKVEPIVSTGRGQLGHLLIKEGSIVEVGQPVAILYMPQSHDSDQLPGQEKAKFHTVRATSSGEISEITTKVGQVIEANYIIGTMIPTDAVAYAEVWVSPEVAGYLKSGTRTTVLFPDFKNSRVAGSIGVVSRQVVAKQTILGSDNAREAKVRVTIDLDRQNIKMGSHELKLPHGLAINASLLIRKQRLYEWLLRKRTNS